MTDAAPIVDFHAIVPAGGAGTRLWPISRQSSPKFLHDLTGTGRSLLQGTYDRLIELAGADGVLIVTGVAHEGAVRAQLPALEPGNLIAEPSPRDSMAAIGLATAIVAARHGSDAVVGSFAADHVIVDTDVFGAAVRTAVDAARSGFIVTIGIAPSGPSTAFGYIRRGDELTGIDESHPVYQVDSFTEKPDAQTAAEYLATGRYWWNAGMFVARAGVLLERLAQYQPELARGIEEIARAWDGESRDEVLARVWPTLTKIAIDHAIAEPVAADGGMAVVPGTFDWDDIGDWASLGPLRAQGPEEDALVRQIDCGGSVVVPSSGRMVVVLGIDDLVVVDTPDALLVTTRNHAQQVKAVVDTLKSEGRLDLV